VATNRLLDDLEASINPFIAGAPEDERLPRGTVPHANRPGKNRSISLCDGHRFRRPAD
jgi:hypothetical protein